MDTSRLYILDNGAHSIKLSHALSTNPPTIHRNAITKSKAERRNYIGNELEENCQDYGGLLFRIPFEKGILTNWDTQKTIWDHVFTTSSIDPSTSSLLLSEPTLNLPNVSDAYDQMIFEEYEFANYLRCPVEVMLAAGGDQVGVGEAVLVVDSGFSRTMVTPVLKGRIVSEGVRRLDVGGKLLTNYLKELISFRQWYMMDQTSVVERAKEECCFVTNRWDFDWERARATSKDTSIVRTYVLPDFVPTSSNKLGYMRPVNNTTSTSSIPTSAYLLSPSSPKGKGKERAPTPPLPSSASGAGAPPTAPSVVMGAEEQLMHLSNERFTVPEVLFNPSTIGLDQSGLPETILQSISALPEEIRGMFWGNILVVGGSAAFEGLGERMENDLRRLAPQDYAVRVTISPTPTLQPLLSARTHLQSPATHSPSPILDSFASRQEYQELGGANLSKKKMGRVYWGKGEVEELLSGG